MNSEAHSLSLYSTSLWESSLRREPEETCVGESTNRFRENELYPQPHRFSQDPDAD